MTGEVFTEVARGTDADRARALHAASGAARAWGSTTARERATVLCEIADRIEEHATELAVAETWDNGKPVREALVADVPMVIELFRQFAAVIRTEVGEVEQLGRDTCDYRSFQPIGVVHERVSWTFPLMNACRVLAPALAMRQRRGAGARPADAACRSTCCWASSPTCCRPVSSTS